MSKIKMLAIAPYAGLAELLNETARQYVDQVELTAVVGDLKIGAQLAGESAYKGYDIIISRGGTTTMIMEKVAGPVVNIGVSGFDYIRAIKMAQNFQRKTAIVGFPYITESARSVSALLGTNITIATIQHIDEIAPLLKQLSSRGYSLFIGDVATERTAREMGLAGMLLTSGEESVRQAIEDAIRLCRSVDHYRDESLLLRRVFEHSPGQVAVFSSSHDLLFSSYEFQNGTVQEAELRKYLDNVLENGRQDITLTYGDELWKVHGRRVETDERPVAAFYISDTPSHLRQRLPGMEIRNVSYQMDDLSALIRETGLYGQDVILSANTFVRSELPVLIYGEEGVGKAHLAYIIHRCSPPRRGPFIEIDCGVMPPATWETLLDEWQERFCGLQTATLCLHRINKLDLSLQARLYRTLAEDVQRERFRVIATATEGLGQMMDENRFSGELYQYISLLTLGLPSLRQRLGEIDNIASLYIIEANYRFGKQVVGMRSDALDRLKQHRWRLNYTELKKVIHQLVLESEGSYIGVSEVSRLLDMCEISDSLTDTVHLDGTLEEMEDTLIRKVLEAENGNYVRTAKRLGISRSTLWRRLKKDNMP